MELTRYELMRSNVVKIDKVQHKFNKMLILNDNNLTSPICWDTVVQNWGQLLPGYNIHIIQSIL